MKVTRSPVWLGLKWFEVILCRFNFNESITYADGTLQVAHLTRRLRERRAKAPTQAEIE